MKEISNDSSVAVYVAEYAEWLKREISETAEQLPPGEVKSDVEGGGLEGWRAFLCISGHFQNNFCFPIPKLYLVKSLQMNILIIMKKGNKNIIVSVKYQCGYLT